MIKFGTPEYEAEVKRQFIEGLPRAMEQVKRFREGFVQDPSIQSGMRFVAEIREKKKEKKQRVAKKIGELKSSVSSDAIMLVDLKKPLEENWYKKYVADILSDPNRPLSRLINLYKGPTD